MVGQGAAPRHTLPARVGLFGVKGDLAIRARLLLSALKVAEPCPVVGDDVRVVAAEQLALELRRR